ncbi:hypothetical protein CW751_00535 [Brumimicrobium salinarum]|uniref:Glutamine amidotransferase domain-containing protein n=1 Tax=Brumimicrobium salinarum TaxID=2058658 RepID=A0A2I0R5M9_9FLAO|nr:hypothetical protein [Brumimicrobium salinarum]PKR81859.1 hypothetical protein CW751_00535 [Brumimicrobium salinarum]
MNRPLKIAIVGDYNFTLKSHDATNQSITYAADHLDAVFNYYWIRLHEIVNFKPNDLKNFDGFWIAPGPFENSFFLNGAIRALLESQLPILITGEGFKIFIETIVKMYKLNPDQEKVVSKNLSSTNTFEQIRVIPVSDNLRQLYEHEERIEYTDSKFSIYPQHITALKSGIIDIEAMNQFEEPEIISLKAQAFCVASISLPQMSPYSPHPLIFSFLNYIQQTAQDKSK